MRMPHLNRTFFNKRLKPQVFVMLGVVLTAGYSCGNTDILRQLNRTPSLLVVMTGF